MRNLLDADLDQAESTEISTRIEPERLPDGKPSTRPHFEFLDGLRGLAALYVMVGHASLLVSAEDLTGSYSGWGRILAFRLWLGLGLGHFAVGVFIVLSGFCLMLPVLKSSNGTLNGGFSNFLWRRVRRIIPPYYAAIAFSLLVIFLIGHHRPAARPDPALTAWDLASHFLMIHNLDDATIFSINAPMWSVATEFQIYLLFPILLAIWRRWGMAATIGLGFLLGYSVFGVSLLTGIKALTWISPWYLGLFALGMAGAVTATSDAPPVARMREWVRWDLISGLLGVALLIDSSFVVKIPPPFNAFCFTDPVLGLAAMCLIIHCVKRSSSAETKERSRLARVLESRPLVGVGAFSYSLYLTHMPLMGLIRIIVPDASSAPPLTRLAMALALCPLCVPVAYLFYLAFEKRFVKSPAAVRGGVSACLPASG